MDYSGDEVLLYLLILLKSSGAVSIFVVVLMLSVICTLHGLVPRDNFEGIISKHSVVVGRVSLASTLSLEKGTTLYYQYL